LRPFGSPSGAGLPVLPVLPGQMAGAPAGNTAPIPRGFR